MTLRKMTGAAIFAAIIAILSQFAIPIGSVPHTLQVMAVALAGVILGPKYGPISVVVWILLGVFGLPVFTMGQSGLGVLFGPLGGFLIGFVFQAGLCGFFRPQDDLIKAMIMGLISLAVVYIVGIMGFMAAFEWLLHKPMTVMQAVTVCAVPFVPFDIVKLVLGIVIGKRISMALEKAGVDLR